VQESCEECRCRGTFEVQRSKAQEEQCLCAQSNRRKEKKVEKPFDVSQSTKLRKDSIPRTQAISKGIEFAEEAKVEAFETSEKHPRGGWKFSSSGGSIVVLRSAGETRSVPSSFTSRQ
jgi:hypothetical protein